MPKREATPEPGEDEPKYFTVVNPWPQNADMEIIGDFIRCCRWLASAIGDPELLLALFHKPSSPRIIIIEVSRQYEAPTHKTSSTYQRIIGKHSWVGSGGMLTNPAGYNERNCSSIFYSCFSTGREVEKNGWKRKWVEEHHLGDPKHPDPTFKIPYPKTTYIETPVLEPIARTLCRPLPRSEFDQLELPVVIAAPTAPVGSSTWAAIRKQKSASSSRSAAHPSQGTSDVYFEPTEPPISESTDTSMNLWAVGEGGAPVGLMSDLAQMSITGEDDEGVWLVHLDKILASSCLSVPFMGHRAEKCVNGAPNTKNAVGQKKVALPILRIMAERIMGEGPQYPIMDVNTASQFLPTLQSEVDTM